MKNVSVGCGSLMLMAVLACGGEETQPGTVVGPAGGTVVGPNGAKVVIPPGALTTDTTINIEQTSDGAPALPAGFSAFGQMFAFTPHGTRFAVPVTLTLPYDAASLPAGTAPALYKTNAQNQWEQVANATFNADSVTGQVTSFSDAQVVIPPLDRGDPVRVWSIREYRGDQLEEVEVDGDTQVGGFLGIAYHIGPAFFDAAYVSEDGETLVESDGIAVADITSFADGKTYWTGVEAPLGNAAIPTDAIGSAARLLQYQTFTKNESGATLTFTVTEAFVEVYDGNGVLERFCPTAHKLPISLSCDLIKGEVYLDVKAYTIGTPTTPGRVFFHISGGATVNGSAIGVKMPPLPPDRSGSWDTSAWTSSKTALWGDEAFTFVEDEFNGPAGHLLMDFNGPITYIVDLFSVGVGQAFTVKVDTYSYSYNRANGVVSGQGAEFESAANTWLRDPLTIGGTSLTPTGLTPISTPLPLVEPVEDPVPPEPCLPGPGPEPAAGVLQFSAASYAVAESNTTTPTIAVTRTGGSSGAVTATFATSDGTAVGGTDYTPVTSTVFFADGDTVQRFVPVPIVPNLFVEPDKTVNLTLSQPGGCAALGAQTTAVLTILNDDVPPPTLFTVGGTVTGLVGTGLVLQNLGTNDLSPANGPFTFTNRYASGLPYDVTVTAQPTNPSQACTVEFGSGTVADANITNVLVTCVTSGTTPGLDPTFGSAGKATTGLLGGATAMALQTDGKIVLCGSKTLTRYKTDGTLDTSFSGGSVTVLMGTVTAVAIQPDDKIVVAGFTHTNTQDDFAVERYDANGILDTSFGGGSVTTDFNGSVDRAWAVLVQTDGKIVVAGHAGAAPTSPVDNDFAVARYTSTGALDMSFGTLGKVTTNIAGRTDLALAAALQPDGGIVVAGRVSDAGAGGDVGLVRYGSNGSPDMGFGVQGIVQTDLATLPSGVALAPDGKILVSVQAVVDGTIIFGAVRFQGNGAVDTGFGIDGLATARFSTLNDLAQAVAVRPGGEIIVVGQSSNSMTNADFGIARFTAGGTLDTSFDGDGKLTVDFFSASDGAECVAVQSDGKIVVGGFARNGTTTGLGLARVLP